MRGSSALSEQYAQFGKGPAQFVMTKEELTKWKEIKDDLEAKAFIDLFWGGRDPAFHTLFDQAVKYADEKLTKRRRRGSMTDLGIVLVVMRPPSSEKKYQVPEGSVPPWSSSGPDRGNVREIEWKRVGTGSTLCWIYDAEETKLPLDSPRIEICFDEKGNGEWLLDHAFYDAWLAPLFERVNKSRLTQPDLSATPASPN